MEDNFIEQRKDYPNILDRLSKIESQVNGGLKEQFDNLANLNQTSWNKHDIEAREFRIEVRELHKDNRQEIINLATLMNNRPCIAHDKDIAVLFKDKDFKERVIIGLLVVLILGLIGYGGLKKQVDINTERWEKVITGEKVI